MKRRTTTAQINEALTSNLLTVTKAEVTIVCNHRAVLLQWDIVFDDKKYKLRKDK